MDILKLFDIHHSTVRNIIDNEPTFKTAVDPYSSEYPSKFTWRSEQPKFSVTELNI